MKKAFQVAKDIFLKELDKKNRVIQSTLMICEPPITFYWDRNFKDMSFGKGSWGYIVRDYDLKTLEEKPTYWIFPKEENEN